MELKQERFYTEDEYMSIEHDGLAEYDNGCIILMSPPSRLHQKICGRPYALLNVYLYGKACEVYAAPFDVRLQLADNVIKHVEPDITVICDRSKLTDTGCEGAPDFIIEVVSPLNKMHDYYTKAKWYEKSGVN